MIRAIVLEHGLYLQHGLWVGGGPAAAPQGKVFGRMAWRHKVKAGAAITGLTPAPRQLYSSFAFAVHINHNPK